MRFWRFDQKTLAIKKSVVTVGFFALKALCYLEIFLGCVFLMYELIPDSPEVFFRFGGTLWEKFFTSFFESLFLQVLAAFVFYLGYKYLSVKQIVRSIYWDGVLIPFLLYCSAGDSGLHFLLCIIKTLSLFFISVVCYYLYFLEPDHKCQFQAYKQKVLRFALLSTGSIIGCAVYLACYGEVQEEYVIESASCVIIVLALMLFVRLWRERSALSNDDG